MVLEMTLNAVCVKPTMKRSVTLSLSVLNFFKNNTNDGMTGWERLCIGIFVERKALMFPINDMNKPLPCTENESFKILLVFHIQPDNIIEHRRPDMIIIDKTKKKAQVVDFAVPADHRIEISQ